MSQSRNLNGSWVRDPVAGLHSSISAPGSRGVQCPCCLVLSFVLPHRLQSGFVKSWMILGGSWHGRVLVGIDKLSFVFRRIQACSLVSLVTLVPRPRWSRWFSFSLCFAGVLRDPPPKPPYQPLIWSHGIYMNTSDMGEWETELIC